MEDVNNDKTGGHQAAGAFIGIRLPASLLEQIVVWSEKHEAATRSEAIRRLVELGLKAKGKT